MVEVKNVLFLDIETVALTQNFKSLDPALQTLWKKKCEFIRHPEGLTPDEIYEQRAGIYSEFGKIICIGVGKIFEEGGSLKLKTKAFAGDNENSVLEEFKAMLVKTDQEKLMLCAHNGKEFDFPYICRRMLINGISLPRCLDLSGKKPWEIKHLDTLEMWKFGDYKNYTSLDLLATIFQIPSSKEDINGSQVNQVYYEEKNLEKIKDYCLRDVVVLTQLFLKMNGMETLHHDNITQA